MLIKLFLGLLAISSICVAFNANFIFVSAIFAYVVKTLVDRESLDIDARFQEWDKKIKQLEETQERELESMRNKVASTQISRTVIDRR